VQGRKIVKRVSLHQKPQFPPSLKLCVLCVSVVKKSLCPTFADLPSSSDRRRHWDMCGRYRRTTQEEELARMYHIPIPRQTDLPISFNIAPSQDVLAVRYDPEKAVRSLVSLRWGLIPSWAKDEKIGYRTINARMETVQTAPAYRKAFKKRRCLVLANGFYEWRRRGGPRVPFDIALKDNEPFAFAGLWEAWKNPVSREWLFSCTIITTEANELISQIHDRMPVILDAADQPAWLGEEKSHDLGQLLRPFPADRLKMVEISTRVNNPKNNDASVLEPDRFSGLFG
jgi:putative SOS response-associated peptidase YedK